MKIQPAALALATATAFGLISGACSITSETPAGTAGAAMNSAGTGGTSAGSSSTAGSGTAAGAGGAATASCSNVTPCGGNAVGTWNVTSSCLKVDGSVDISGIGVGCKSAKVTGALTVTGSWTANADGTYTDKTTTSGTETLELPVECLSFSGLTITCDGLNGPMAGVGYSEVSCGPAATGGGCTCAAKVQQTGGIGVVSVDPQKSGNYKTDANVLTSDGTTKYPYCVSGSTLTLSAATTTPITTGSIVLQNGGGSMGGAGGAGGGGAGGMAGTGTGGAAGSAGAGGGTTAPTEGPCDIYAAAKTPCAAAYSTIRALSKTYTGPLYQVRNGSSAMNTGSGGMTKDISMNAAGFADTAAQDAFCMGSTCTFSLLYDQSGNGNHLKVAPKGLSAGGTYAAMDDFESSATKGSMMVGGHKVYSLYMAAREGYRLTAVGKGMPLGTASEGIYILADGTHSGTACCWDFGNVSTDPTKYGVMNTIFFGTGFWGKGAGSGPWFLGDFEGGVWAGGSGGSNVTNSMSPSMKVQFALGMLKTSSNKYALRMADLSTANDLTTAYDGASPKQWANTGGILIGIGGDNSNNSWGTFYEGAIVSGIPATLAESNPTDLAVMKNIKAVGYGK
jgi:Alpha-L-arabinofuranosidase B, catalytic